MNEIASEEKMKKMEKLRKYLFRGAIWLLIAGVVLGVVMILVGDDSEEMREIIGKTIGTILLVAFGMVMVTVGLLLFRSKKVSVQNLSVTGVATGVGAVLLGVLAIWFWRPLFYACHWDSAACEEYRRSHGTSFYHYTDYYADGCPRYVGEECDFTILYRLLVILSLVAVYGFVAAGIMNMYEGKRKDLIRPLKIVALVLTGYEALYLCYVMGFMDVVEMSSDWEERALLLAGFSAVIWVMIVLVAWVISRIEKKRLRAAQEQDGAELAKGALGQGEGRVKEEKNGEMKVEESGNGVEKRDEGRADEEDAQSETKRVKSDEELRAEIEEKVRREMIEKEVRERLEREQRERIEKKEREAKEQEESWETMGSTERPKSDKME